MDTVSKIGNAELEHILAKTRDAAAGGIGALFTGKALVAAPELDRRAAMNAAQSFAAWKSMQ